MQHNEKNKNNREQRSASVGVSFNGTFHIDRMFDIHDNHHVEVHNHYGSPAAASGAEQQKDKPSSSKRVSRKPEKSFAQFVVLPEYEASVIDKLHELVERQTDPKDIMMPIRAAMDAGAIGRPTWEIFRNEFGKDCISSKALFTKYTSPDYKYEGEIFRKTMSLFGEIITK